MGLAIPVDEKQLGRYGWRAVDARRPRVSEFLYVQLQWFESRLEVVVRGELDGFSTCKTLRVTGKAESIMPYGIASSAGPSLVARPSSQAKTLARIELESWRCSE